MARGKLSVWLYGTHVADLEELGSDGVVLTWTADAYDRWGEGSRVMAQLLPVSRAGTTPHPRRAKVFIEGLLPEGNARTNYALDVGVRPDDVFGLISVYGRDTAGALIFQPPELPSPTRVGNYVSISDDEIGERLLAIDRHSPTDPNQRGIESISLAGMQPKIGLHHSPEIGWQTCQNGAPSTYIIKLAHPPGSIAEDVVDTEVLSVDLARFVGLTTVNAQLHRFGPVRAIAVSRYDRNKHPDGRITRVHQEDLAQALGIDTTDPERKFQRGRQLPSFKDAARVLRDGGSEPDRLLQLATFNFLIGNTDAHAKNISMLRQPDGRAVLAPAYDVAMHLHHDRRNPLSAMDINGKYAMNDIDIADLVSEGQSWPMSAKRAAGAVAGIVESLDVALNQLDLANYPRVSSAAVATVRGRVDRAKSQLARPIGFADGSAAPATVAPGADLPGEPRRRGPRKQRP